MSLVRNRHRASVQPRRCLIAGASVPLAVSLPTLAVSLPTRTGSHPSKADLLSWLPPDLLDLNPRKAWTSLGWSVGLSLLAFGLGSQIPLTPAAAPLWLLYAVVTGTVAQW